jgi:hypothetical protein
VVESQPSAIGLGDTERLTDGLGDEAKSRSLSTEHPSTGKPDAGEPPVRFGGRGKVQSLVPTPIGGSIQLRPNAVLGQSRLAAGRICANMKVLAVAENQPGK